MAKRADWGKVKDVREIFFSNVETVRKPTSKNALRIELRHMSKSEFTNHFKNIPYWFRLHVEDYKTISKINKVLGKYFVNPQYLFFCIENVLKTNKDFKIKDFKDLITRYSECNFAAEEEMIICKSQVNQPRLFGYGYPSWRDHIEQYAAFHSTTKLSRYLFDTVELIKQLNSNLKINLRWGAKRLIQEHDKLSQQKTLRTLKKQKVQLKVASIFTDNLLPEDRYTLLKDTFALGMEGYNMQHCVASYAGRVNGKDCCIYHTEIDRVPYTIEIGKSKNDVEIITGTDPYKPINTEKTPVLTILQMQGKRNSAPTKEHRDQVRKDLAKINARLFEIGRMEQELREKSDKVLSKALGR